MPTEPVQVFLILLEIAMLVAGAGLLLALFARPELRARWLQKNTLPGWPVTMHEFLVFVSLIFATGLILTVGLNALLAGTIANAPDKLGLQTIIGGWGLHGGGLVGWGLFQIMRRHWYADYGANPPPALKTEQSLSMWNCFHYGVLTLLAALPLITLVSLIWNFVLTGLGLPEEPQELIAIFADTKSQLVLLGMLVAACVLAPFNEELLFRGGIYRFLRQRVGKAVALFACGTLFGLMHGSWSGFLPLSVLGAILAISYEATGDIRVPIIAHALFNLNTVLVVLSGLSEIAQ